jgi:4a-hydroxytetrahydrobiopterin dehydratase
MKTSFYTEDEVIPRLVFLPGWKFEANALHQNLEFRNFREAFLFMTFVAFLAEKMDHHPDWSNSYSKVKISLSTHTAGGVTDKDFELAEQINRYVSVPNT